MKIVDYWDRFMGVFDGVGTRFQRAIEKRLRIQCYTLVDGVIVRDRGRRIDDFVEVSQIVRWQVYPEMVFDIVQIELRSGNVVVWLDHYGDLLAILYRAATPFAEKRDDFAD